MNFKIFYFNGGSENFLVSSNRIDEILERKPESATPRLLEEDKIFHDLIGRTTCKQSSRWPTLPREKVKKVIDGILNYVGKNEGCSLVRKTIPQRK